MTRVLKKKKKNTNSAADDNQRNQKQIKLQTIKIKKLKQQSFTV